MIGLVTALTGRRVAPNARKAIVLVDGGVRAVAARLGEHALGFPDERLEFVEPLVRFVSFDPVVYRRFLSVVVTDSDPARLVFTGTVRGPGVTAGSSLAMWSVSPSAGVNLLLRTGQEIDIGGETLTVRVFDALKAPRKSMERRHSCRRPCLPA